MTDTAGVSCSANVTILVVSTPTCNTTNADDDYYQLCEDTAFSSNVLLNDSDAQNDVQLVDATVTPLSGFGPFNGTVTILPNGDFTYTPNAGFTGHDQFSYEVVDDGLVPAIDRATVYFDVAVDTNTTFAIDDINFTRVDTPVDGNVLTNDIDPEGDVQTVTTTTVTSSQGVVVTIDAVTGAYTYTPPAGYIGVDSFVYSIVDNRVVCPATDNATVFINVDPVCIATADAFESCIDTTVARGSVLANDIDPDIVLTTGNITTASGGVAVMQADGFFTYTPAVGFEGLDSFTYTMRNNSGLSCDAPVTIEVENTCAPPDAVDDFYNECEAFLPITGNVLLNDSTDSEIPTESISVDVAVTSGLPGPFNGAVVINAAGDFTYTPNSGYLGPDRFVYEIVDTGGDRDRATVYLYVYDNKTFAIDDINFTRVDTPVDGNVLTNDIAGRCGWNTSFLEYLLDLGLMNWKATTNFNFRDK
jgi:hypothetical protein